MLEQVSLHRTKCSKLITEVIVPTFKNELIWDVKYGNQALLGDESIDVSAEKI